MLTRIFVLSIVIIMIFPSTHLAEDLSENEKRHSNSLKNTALVITDPQNDFLHPSGVAWPLVKESVQKVGTIENLEKLFKVAENKQLMTFISPHYYYPSDYKWNFTGEIEGWMHTKRMYFRKGPLTTEGLHGSGADFLELFKPYINNEQTIIASPHKIYGPENNDLILQLRKNGIDHVILAGMAANLCVESHMRELIEQGFRVTVVTDATAGTQLNGLDGYNAAMTNFQMIANDSLSTEKVFQLILSLK